MAATITNFVHAKVTKAEIYALLKTTYNIPAYLSLESFETDPVDSTYYMLIFKDTR